MKIRTHYTSYVTLATFTEAIKLCQYAKSLGVSVDEPHRNDGKRLIMRYPNCLGGLSWMYRLVTDNAVFEASRATSLPKQCFEHISLENGEEDGYFDVCEYNNVDIFRLMRKMRKNADRLNTHLCLNDEYLNYIKGILERRGEKCVEVYWAHQKEAKTRYMELPTRTFGMNFGLVCVVKALHQEQTPIYSVVEIKNYTEDIIFDFVADWKLSLVEALKDAIAYFTHRADYSHFWNQYGGEIKFDTPRMSGKCNPDAAYKIGDKVRIKSLEWYNMFADKYGNIEFEDEDGDFGMLMSEYCGKVMTITGKKCSSQYTLDLTSFWWPDWCFEKVEDEVDYYPSTLTKNKGKAKTYLMHDANTQYTKIGKSVNPRHREKTLQAEKPTITMFAVCENDVEKRLHVKYAYKRIRGEWFDLSQEDIENIISEYGFERKIEEVIAD